jgi:hypothetical protein
MPLVRDTDAFGLWQRNLSADLLIQFEDGMQGNGGVQNTGVSRTMLILGSTGNGTYADDGCVTMALCDAKERLWNY